MGSKTARVASLVIVTGLVTSGCTGSAQGPEATGGPAPSASEPASASPSPSLPTKPDRPEAMERDDAEGAAAAAGYFIELYPYVMATGDTEEFEAMSHRGCGFCDDALRQANRIEAREYIYTGGESRLAVTTAYVRDGVTGIYPLDVEISQEASRITDGGVEIYSAEAKVSMSRIEMGMRDDVWVVVALAPIPENEE